MCGVEPKPQQNAIVGVCIALAVVVIAVVVIPYVIITTTPPPPEPFYLSTLKVFGILGFLCGVGWLITWLIKPDEQQTFDPPV